MLAAAIALLPSVPGGAAPLRTDATTSRTVAKIVAKTKKPVNLGPRRASRQMRSSPSIAT
jgi:hypothetical protein